MVEVWRSPEGDKIRYRFEEEAEIFQVTADWVRSEPVSEVPPGWVKLGDTEER